MLAKKRNFVKKEEMTIELYQNYIEMNPAIRFGKPCVKNTRITVYDVLGWLAAGMSVPQIVRDFPELNVAAIRACLLYAAQKERRVKIVIG